MPELLNVTALLNSLKRLWWIPLLTLVLGIGLSAWLCRRLPKVYQASTLILVEPQKIPTNYVKPIVTTPIENRIKTIQQQVSSRSRLETIINGQNLFANLRDTVPMEDLVARVDRNIRVEVRGTSTFKIYYEDVDPQIAARVANAVAELFINENVNARKAEARSTTVFLEQQLAEKKRDLEDAEARISEFNRSHMAELPAQRDVNFALLEGFRGRLKSIIDEISKQQDRKIVLEKDLAELPASGVTNVLTAATDLDQKRARLIELKSLYTEQHPEVIVLKRQIAQLEEQLARKAEDKTPDTEPPPPTQGMTVREQQLRRQIGDIDLSIKDLTRESQRLKDQIGEYESRVANGPRNEQALLGLKRDYDILQQSYLDMLRNKTQAVIAETLEQERQGESFVVLDRAIPPVRPYKPNVNQILSFGSALGLMMGVGLALLLDLARPKFHSEDELVAAFNIPVLISIPAIASAEPHGGLERNRKLLLGTGILAALLIMVAIFGLMRG